MRRLYWRIYTGFVLVVFIFALMLAGLWYWSPADSERERTLQAISVTLGEMLPGADRPVAELQSVLARLGQRFNTSLSVYESGGGFIAASTGDREAAFGEPESGWIHEHNTGSQGYSLSLPDGRWLVARKDHHRRKPLLPIILALGLAIAIGAHPLARRITRRLERLKTHVDALGQGDLGARVAVEGRDEVADLARHFNLTAQRIEALVEAQRATLASASHELRTPLTRIRMAVELIAGTPESVKREALLGGIVSDISELDDLIEELLLASRLRAHPEPDNAERIELLALMAQEGARVGAQVTGEALQVDASTRLVRRLLRNLFENAQRYGRNEDGRAEIQASVHRSADNLIVIQVEDNGPGVPEGQRERIFEPFFRPPGLHEGDDPGVGLGLSLVRDIARHYGGDVSCEQRPEGGSRFEVTLQLRISEE